MSHAVQSYIIFRAKMNTPDFSPGPESLECALFPLEDIPFDSLAFSSIFVTLKMVSVPWMIGNSFVIWLQCLFGVLYDPRHDIFLLWLLYPHTRTYVILHASDAVRTLFYSELFNCIWWGLSSHHLGVPIDDYYWGDLGSLPKPKDANCNNGWAFHCIPIWSQVTVFEVFCSFGTTQKPFPILEIRLTYFLLQLSLKINEHSQNNQTHTNLTT